MNDSIPLLAFNPNVFDWDGPAFLAFYAICLMIALIWSSKLGARVMKRFDVSGEPTLHDPYEVAYLSGGASRVAQLAVVRLIAAGKVRWEKKMFGDRLILAGDSSQSGLKTAEKAILDAIRSRGDKGLKAAEAGLQVGPAVQALEIRLAKLGLRPTASEKATAAISKSWPVALLLVLGVIKLLVGLSRDKPVAFLVVALFVTLILVFVMGRTGGYLTPAGVNLLGKLRLQHQDRRRMRVSSAAEDMAGVSLGLALFGASSLSAVAGMEHLQKDLAKQVGPGGGDGGGGGCGAGGTSGCGTSGCSSGCGGGGCGGCGGGGD